MPTRFQLRVDAAWLQEIDAWRKAQRRPLSRAAAIRCLVSEAMNHTGISKGEQIIIKMLEEIKHEPR